MGPAPTACEKNEIVSKINLSSMYGKFDINSDMTKGSKLQKKLNRGKRKRNNKISAMSRRKNR